MGTRSNFVNCLRCRGVMLSTLVDADITIISIKFLEAWKCQSCSCYYWLSLPSEPKVTKKRSRKFGASCKKEGVKRAKKRSFLASLDDLYKVKRKSL